MRYKETKFGKIPWDWAVLPVKAVAEVVTDYVANGSFASLAKNVKYKETEDVAILIRLVDYNNGFKNNFVYIDEHAYEFLAKSKLFGDEIIISNVGINVGTVFRCPHLKYKMSLGPNAIMVRFAGNNDFYYYWLKGFQGQQMLRSIVTGSVQPKFNKTNFRDMLVPVPPIVIQNRIVTILNCLDRKIELNNNIIENLEQQAQTFYQELFINHANPEWKQGHLSDLIIVRYGKDHKKLADGSVPVFGSGGLMRKVERPLYDKESVLIPRKGTLNNVMYINEPFWSVDTMFYTEMKFPNIAKFVYHFLKSKDLASMNAGSAVPSMTTDILNTIEIRIPSRDVLATFENIVSPMYETMQHCIKESAKLATIRDSLLPKLMSGEIDVSELQF